MEKKTLDLKDQNLYAKKDYPQLHSAELIEELNNTLPTSTTVSICDHLRVCSHGLH